MISQRQQALSGLLTLIGSSEKEVEGRIRIQKEAFLLGARGVASFNPDEFVYHYHGPYSRALSDLLHDTVSLGFIKECKETYGNDAVRYSYSLTEDGHKLLKTVAGKDEKEVCDLAPMLHQCHWRGLELAATVAFLERKKTVRNREDAFAEALKRKPDCSGYVAEAKEALKVVGI